MKEDLFYKGLRIVYDDSMPVDEDFSDFDKLTEEFSLEFDEKDLYPEQ